MAKTLGDITQELSEKVLAPARAEADELVRSAREQAAAIVAEAGANAEKTRAAAKSEAEKVLKQMQVDMETAARNFIIMVKEKLEAAVVTPVVEGEIRALLNDKGFLEHILEIVLAEFSRVRAGNARSRSSCPRRIRPNWRPGSSKSSGRRPPGRWWCISPTRSPSGFTWACRAMAHISTSAPVSWRPSRTSALRVSAVISLQAKGHRRA